ncbi:hypothetical protein Oweho_0022 [Owenweeksia hongkongensis DSM 17368]|uniref:Outer membrane protein beta-barrel domain-containing protein n=1 Tax=Owenweeksia hongkongensis (strain DSM 17368 / CIP 108786 / JCM 12287 / NRRL B-23963 / UST20020801) TaxID=926562 RepID=G8R536_OWEHD|nr:hypothetical protein [Owenweeksia hongkongensis]AEV31047.1 hypothetical protein Oweho_0022 [Owenweeksia hongkongensis DSM 17368]
MNKLKLTFLLLFVTSASFGQQQKPQVKSIDEPSSLFEVNLGLVSYSYFNVLAPSLQFNIAAPVSRYFSFGVLLSLYSTPKPASRKDYLGNKVLYSPQGVRGGFLLRASTNPAKSHFYGELIGTGGKAFQTGVSKNLEESKANEFMGGGNIGVNFKGKNNSFFGVYTGFSLGKLNFDMNDDSEKITRFQFGFTYHMKT